MITSTVKYQCFYVVYIPIVDCQSNNMCKPPFARV